MYMYMIPGWGKYVFYQAYSLPFDPDIPKCCNIITYMLDVYLYLQQRCCHCYRHTCVIHIKSITSRCHML
jgi:hypothetical protein